MEVQSNQLTIRDFAFFPEEKLLMISLLQRFKPQSIAEFGCGSSTKILAENSQAHIVTWDDTTAWVEMVRKTYAGEPWIERIDFREYNVTPMGPISVRKKPVPWDGGVFDFLFLDGPRAAHETSFGRSGTFEFATRNARPGACILWHDANGSHEIEWAFRCFRHCRIRHVGRLNWCIWKPPSPSAWPIVLWNLQRRRYWPLLRRFKFADVLSGSML